MVVRWTRKDPHEHDSIGLHRYHLGHCRVRFLVPDDYVCPRAEEQVSNDILHARVGVTVHVLVVIVDPQVPLHCSHRVRPGLGTGSLKQDESRSSVVESRSGSTTLKCGRRKVGRSAKPAARTVPNVDVRTLP